MARCPFPEKDKLTKAGAVARAIALSRRPGARRVEYYHCSAGGHHHVGHRMRPKRKRW